MACGKMESVVYGSLVRTQVYGSPVRIQQVRGKTMQNSQAVRVFNLLLLGFCLFAFLGYSQTIPPREEKESALELLQTVTTTDKKLKQTIASVKDAIEQSLSDKGNSLFLDDFRLLPFPQGKRVFDKERHAVSLIQTALSRKDLPVATRNILQQVIEKLVAADREIAQIALDVAEMLLGLGEGDAKELVKAKKEFEKALAEVSPVKAIDGFEKAWHLAQKAVDHKRFRLLVITEFQDQPDPFSPQNFNTLTTTFKIHRSLLHPQVSHTKFFLELVEVIKNSSNVVVRTITTRQEVTLPLPHPKQCFIEMTVKSVWDGRDQNGQVVADGTYSYLAFGRLIKVFSEKEKFGEKVRAESLPVSGSMVFDSSAPQITEITPANGAILNNASPILSARFSDASGVNVGSVQLCWII